MALGTVNDSFNGTNQFDSFLLFGSADGSEAACSVTDLGFRTHLVEFAWDDNLTTCSGLSSNWTCPKELTIVLSGWTVQ